MRESENSSIIGNVGMTGKKLAAAQRASERKAYRQLAEQHRKLLDKYRACIGSDRRQQARLRRFSALPQVLDDNEQSASSVRGSEGVSVTGHVPRDFDHPSSSNLQESARRQPETPNQDAQDGSQMKARKSDNPKAPLQVLRKLKSIAFHDESVPHEVKVRQLRALLRRKGFSDQGLESFLGEAPPHPPSPSFRENPVDAAHSEDDQTYTLYGQGVVKKAKDIFTTEERPVTPPAGAVNSREDRHAEVRRKREKQERKRQAALAQKIQRKTNTHSMGDDSLHMQISSLEKQIAEATSAASKYGLKKQLAAKKAILVRQERQAEQRKREAERETARLRQADKQRPESHANPSSGSFSPHRIPREDEEGVLSYRSDRKSDKQDRHANTLGEREDLSDRYSLHRSSRDGGHSTIRGIGGRRLSSSSKSMEAGHYSSGHQQIEEFPDHQYDFTRNSLGGRTSQSRSSSRYQKSSYNQETSYRSRDSHDGVRAGAEWRGRPGEYLREQMYPAEQSRFQENRHAQSGTDSWGKHDDSYHRGDRRRHYRGDAPDYYYADGGRPARRSSRSYLEDGRNRFGDYRTKRERVGCDDGYGDRGDRYSSDERLAYDRRGDFAPYRPPEYYDHSSDRRTSLSRSTPGIRPP